MHSLLIAFASYKLHVKLLLNKKTQIIFHFPHTSRHLIFLSLKGVLGYLSLASHLNESHLHKASLYLKENVHINERTNQLMITANLL